VVLLYVSLYSVGHFFVETLRIDPALLYWRLHPRQPSRQWDARPWLRSDLVRKAFPPSPQTIRIRLNDPNQVSGFALRTSPHSLWRAQHCKQESASLLRFVRLPGRFSSAVGRQNGAAICHTTCTVVTFQGHVPVSMHK
jgi:hypothetical protein